jgi:hypothetical protein
MTPSVRFAEAWWDLMQTLQEPGLAARLTAAFSVAAQWESRGERVPYRPEVLLASGAVRIVLDHLYFGRPLVFPPEVRQAYIDAGERIETPLADCEHCGYPLPRSFSACPLCGGRVKVGAYARRRAGRAALN